LSFDIVTIRELDGDGDGLLFPIPSSEVNGIELEPADGKNVMTAQVASISVNTGRENSRVVMVPDVKATLYVTDCRVALACTKFDKGGGYFGLGVGAVVAFGANAVSKARAAGRRRGRSLVGQVRYPWLTAVGYSPKRGFTTREGLRLAVRDQERDLLVKLDLTFPKSVVAQTLALEIVRRASSYNLERVVYNEAEAKIVRALAVSKPKQTAGSGVVGIGFPRALTPVPSTAYGDREVSANGHE